MKSYEYVALGLGAYLLTKPLVKKYLESDFDAPITAVSRAHGNNPNLIKAIIKHESGFNPDAHNYNPPTEDSRGLGQINVLQIQVLKNLSIDPARLYEPEYNIEAINKFIDDIETRYHTTWDIIDAYNAGKAVKYDLNDKLYVAKVFASFEIYEAYA